jgi:hypothetical protein
MKTMIQVRLTKKEELVETRVMAAETLAYMIEVSEELQRIAAISNHLVPTMASFLWWEPDTSSVISRYISNRSFILQMAICL